jgi:hypothetical protein
VNTYPAARSALWMGDIDVTTPGALVPVLVDQTYTFDPLDVALADIGGQIASGPALVGIDVVDGHVRCDPVTFVAVPDGVIVAGIVIHYVPADMVVAFVTRRADAVPLNPTVGNGNDIRLHFVDYLLKI